MPDGVRSITAVERQRSTDRNIESGPTLLVGNGSFGIRSKCPRPVRGWWKADERFRSGSGFSARQYDLRKVGGGLV